MRRIEKPHLSAASRRLAFTLIELLVVIAIIAALISLSAAGVIKFVGSQQQANTKATLDRTQSRLNQAWPAVKDDALNNLSMSEQVPGGGGQTVKQYIQANLAGTDANAAARTRVLYVKLRLRQAFPMTFAEALNPYPFPPLPAYAQYLTNMGVQPNTAYGNFESSACLLMALQRRQRGGGVDPSDLTAGGATGSFTVPGTNNNIPYLTDAWGMPLFFTRVPVGSSLLNTNPYPGPPGPGQTGNNDPGDPQGYLQTANWATMFGTLFTQLTLQKLAGSNSSYKLAPMLASAGQDKQWQTDPVTFACPAGADDLFSNP